MASTAEHAPSRPSRYGKSFTPLRLGPVARSRTLIDGMGTPSNSLRRIASKTDQSNTPVRYPRIIVKDRSGRTLDTFTALQEAIYRASWNRKKMGEWPKRPLEWRLPKAPVPSRPDFSRAGPRSVTSLDLNSGHAPPRHVTTQSHDVTSDTKRIDLTANVLVHIPTMEIPVDDVAFVAESLNHLPTLPSFSFLRHSILAGQSTYVQIVASILLHQRQLRATDQRDGEWEFPGFCSGCKRAGFCYGCSKNPKPHVHEDIPAMIGGGFRFWKRDRPRDPHFWKHPSTWRLPSTDQELKDIIHQYGGLAAYEQALNRARQEMAKKRAESQEESGTGSSGFQRLTNLGTYPPYVTIVSTDDYGRGLEEESEEEEEELDDVDRAEEDKVRERRISRRLSRRSTREDVHAGRKRRIGISSLKEGENDASGQNVSEYESDESADRTLVRVDTGYFEEMSDLEKEKEEGESIVNRHEDIEESGAERDAGRSRHVSRGRTRSSQTGSESIHSQGQTKGATSPNRKTSRLDFIDKRREMQEEEEARLRMERAKENVPFGKKRKDVLYKVPKFFTVKQRERRITVAKDPFSAQRDLNLPRGPTFQLKKSDKKATQFVDFKKSDRGWKAPKKFELKDRDENAVGLGAGRGSKAEDGKRRGRRGDGDAESDEEFRRRRRQDLSPDSGLDSATTGGKGGSGDGKDAGGSSVDGHDGQKNEADKDKLTGAGEGEGGGDGQAVEAEAGDGGDGDASGSGKPKRREVVKKTRVEKVVATPPQSPPRLPSPPMFKRRSTTDWTPSPPRSPEPEPEQPPLPELDLPSIPDLPDIEDKSPEKRKQKQKFIVEPPPPAPIIKEEPKKRRGPPKVRIIPKNLSRPRRSRPAEAPVTSEELMDIQDPLDFLAKWCIINPDRLPFYEIVFESAVADQAPRYNKPAPWEQKKGEEEKKKDEGENKEEVKEVEKEEKDGKKKKGKKKKKSSKEREKKDKEELNPNLLPADRGLNVQKATMTVEEQHLEKLIYTLDLLQDKMEMLGTDLEDLEAKRIKLLAHKARETFPEIASPDYFPKKKKGKKGKKKDKKPEEPERKLRHDEITDEVIVGRLEDKMLNELCREQDMKHLEVEIEILRDKIKEVQRRVEEMAREKLLADAFCMNHYFLRQGIQNSQPDDFKRQQSELYNRLHPNPDYEMNLEEVEESLQQINNHLLTEKEFYFLYSILDLPSRERINFRLFSVIAALSEKVTQLDPVIRKLINSFNYNALDIKMEKCKELFDLLEADNMPRGAAQAASLAVELNAGGLRPEHTNFVLNKFNRESKGVIDFLDFVTYVPLFVEIHKRIVQDPLNENLDL